MLARNASTQTADARIGFADRHALCGDAAVALPSACANGPRRRVDRCGPSHILTVHACGCAYRCQQSPLPAQAALPPEMALSVQRQLFLTSWAVMDTSPRPAAHAVAAAGPPEGHMHAKGGGGGHVAAEAAAAAAAPCVGALHVRVANVPAQCVQLSPAVPARDVPMGDE